MKKVLSTLLLLAMLLSMCCVASASGKTIKTTGKVFVREDASTSAKALQTIDKGTELTMLGSKADKRGITWYYVEYKSGKKGYISSMYTTSPATKASKEASSEKAKTKTAKKSYTIYDKKLNKIGTLKKGAEYTDLNSSFTDVYTVKEGKKGNKTEYKVTDTYEKIWYGNQKVGYILVKTEKEKVEEESKTEKVEKEPKTEKEKVKEEPKTEKEKDEGDSKTEKSKTKEEPKTEKSKSKEEPKAKKDKTEEDTE